MSRKPRREDVEEMFERLRLASCECSGAGLEETEESEVEQKTATNTKKEFCAECHMSFGSAEPRVALDQARVVHEDCYVKILHKQRERANRITAFSRHIH